MKQPSRTDTDLEVAEQYVEWAAARGMTAEHVADTITRWPHLKLTDNEREYIRTLARRHCRPHGWRETLTMKTLVKWIVL